MKTCKGKLGLGLGCNPDKVKDYQQQRYGRGYGRWFAK